MWSQDNNNGSSFDGQTTDSPNLQYYTDNGNDWDVPGLDRGRERGTVQPSFDRNYLTNPETHNNVSGIDSHNIDTFGHASHLSHVNDRDPTSLSGSHNSATFALSENFYHDHPALNNGADDYGYRSNSVASNSSVTNNNNSRYLYERLSHDHSPALEALSQNTAARIQSFDSGMSGIGAGLHSQGGDMRGSGSTLHSRHARRLYVGGIPQNQTSEEMLQHFLNDVCSKCLEEENDNSYVISVYMNHKKCFAFVELKSIELTSVCLELDGIVYCSNILKIQRANEYKPELMVNVPRTPIHFNLKKAPFPNKSMGHGGMLDKKQHMYGMHDDHVGNQEYSPHSARSNSNSSDTDKRGSIFNFPNNFSSSIIRSCSITEISRGSLVILGFPYDEGARRAGQLTGSATGPRAARMHLYSIMGGLGSGGVVNPEFDVDWSQQGIGFQLCDVGDVPLGLLLEDALGRLGDMVSEIIRRGGVPVVLGGSGDLSYANAAGLMTVAGGSIGIVSVNSHLNVVPQRIETKIQATSASRLLLSDTRFCPPREGLMSEPWCDGKFVHIAAQGSQCSVEDVNFVEQRGGKIVWLSKDIREVNPFTLLAPTEEDGQLVKHGSCTELPPVPTAHHATAPHCPSCHPADRLAKLMKPMLSQLKGVSRKRPIYVSLHLEAVHDSVVSGVSTRSYDGLSAQEASQLCQIVGMDENVALFDICGLNTDIEEMKSPVFVAQLAYSFILGFMKRRKGSDHDNSTSCVRKPTPPLRSEGVASLQQS